MGGTFREGGPSGTGAATVADFALDKYEVTVARFRKFVHTYTGHPAKGAGAHPLIPNSGWQSPSWDGLVDANQTDLATAIKCDATYQTYSETANDNLPMNCVDWYEAFAFCAWDGGRLPTQAEWQYAASGGSDQFVAPWGNAPYPPDVAHANWNCLGDHSAAQVCAFGDILPVGSASDGGSKYGQLDLLGSVAEWGLDIYGDYPATCNNCAALSGGTQRVLFGASWGPSAEFPSSSTRWSAEPDAVGSQTQIAAHNNGFGFRCARTP